MVLGAISGATSQWPPLPSCRVGNMLHSISGWFKVGLGWLVNAYSSHFIHNAKEVGQQSTEGPFLGMQGDGFASKPGGIVEVAVWLCIPLLLGLWCSLGLVPDYVVLVLGIEGGVPHHMQGCHTRNLWIGLTKLVVLTLNIHKIFNWDYNFFCSWYLCLAQRLI